MKNDSSDSSQVDQWNLFPNFFIWFFFVRDGGGGGKNGGNGVCESSVTLYQPVV